MKETQWTKEVTMRNFWCVLFVVSLAAESVGEQMTGTLGGSVTFHLKTSKEFTQISWLTTFRERPVLLATVHVDPPCRTSVVRSEFQGRLNVFGDCKNLQISNLYQNDSGTYYGQIGDYDETFILKVYKNLTENDLVVQCRNDTFGDGNYTLQLNCSAGRWEDGVNYTWTSQSKNGKSSSQTVQIQDDDANYTCTADNPVSKASKTVSVQNVCEAAQPTTGPGTVASTETGVPPKEQTSSGQLVPLWITLAILAIAAIVAACFLWKKKRAARRKPLNPTGYPVPDESSKTVYSQIDCLPPVTLQTGTKKPQPQPRKKNAPCTIYSTVASPKLTPLQTDDEKMQMEGHEGSKKSEKTIYLAATKPQETDDPSIKTLYETVNAPRCSEGSSYKHL